MFKEHKHNKTGVLMLKSDYLRIPITMPPNMVKGLEALSMKAKTTGGKKLANTELVRAATQFLLDSGIDVSGCKDEVDVLKSLKSCCNLND